MRIIGGSLKGKIILPPPEFKARPTTDVAKEALFNILDNEFEFEGLNVLDLFSGTGSISYEFASRGVGHVWSVEMNQQYSSFIKDQAKKLGLKNLTAVHHNVFDFIPISIAVDFLSVCDVADAAEMRALNAMSISRIAM